jgi:hypothetical protein
VYYLANDAVLDQAIAFLNSVRRYNPTIPLWLVPFDDRVDAVLALRDRYAFDVWHDADLLAQCDAISERFHGTVLGHYRKLALWEGPLQRFLYIDCDTVVLEPLDFVFEYLNRADVITAHSDGPGMRRWVWRDSMTPAVSGLTETQLAYSANTGFICSWKGCLPFAGLAARISEAYALRDHLQLDCYEQPVLNYLIVTSGRRYTSLHTIAVEDGRSDIPMERWAATADEVVVRDGRIVSPASPRTLLLHWAGHGQQARQTNPQIPLYELWRFYRDGSAPATPIAATRVDH